MYSSSGKRSRLHIFIFLFDVSYIRVIAINNFELILILIDVVFDNNFNLLQITVQHIRSTGTDKNKSNKNELEVICNNEYKKHQIEI